MEQPDSVKHFKVILPNEFSKIQVTRNKIIEHAPEALQVIIYVSTKQIAYMLHKSFANSGYAAVVHGDITHQERDDIVELFNRQHIQFLITTDVLARGFDHSGVNLVINHFLLLKSGSSSSSEDPEPNTNAYLQRFCSCCPNGAVFNLLCGDSDDKIMTKIERVLKLDVVKVSPWRSNEEYEVALHEAGLN